MNPVLAQEELHVSPEFRLVRRGRYLIASLLSPHAVLSTSVRNGGEREDVEYVVNHQSCEAADHSERQVFIKELGLDAYHDAACLEVGLDPAKVALMGTAANMNYASVVARADLKLSATAIVTAGVQGNASCAGDPSTWRETSEGAWQKIVPYAGTINTMLLINQPLTRGTLAQCAVTMTEAKMAALQRLSIRSLYSQDAATGTGTDQFSIAAPLSGRKPLTSASTHVKLGEIIGVAVREATLEALRWQNGLEPSYTRSIFHALKPYGLSESSFDAQIAGLLTERQLELLKRNSKAVFYEPLVSAAAFAIAAVLDRFRYGTLPASAVGEALRQQAAGLAVSLAARPDCWLQFYNELGQVDASKPETLILRAIALGWSSKWQ